MRSGTSGWEFYDTATDSVSTWRFKFADEVIVSVRNDYTERHFQRAVFRAHGQRKAARVKIAIKSCSVGLLIAGLNIRFVSKQVSEP